MIKKLSLYILVTLFIIFSGCGARTGVGVKDNNLLNVFNTDMNYKDAGNIIYDMSRYCKSGLYIIERENFVSLNKSTITSKLDGTTKGYYMLIEAEKITDTTSKVSVYHYYNYQNTRNMAKNIEEWVNNNSKVCVSGF